MFPNDPETARYDRTHFLNVCFWNYPQGDEDDLKCVTSLFIHVRDTDFTIQGSQQSENLLNQFLFLVLLKVTESGENQSDSHSQINFMLFSSMTKKIDRMQMGRNIGDGLLCVSSADLMYLCCTDSESHVVLFIQASQPPVMLLFPVSALLKGEFLNIRARIICEK